MQFDGRSSLLPARLVLAALVLLAFPAAAVSAHRPIETDTLPSHFGRAIEIEDPSVSQVYYAVLEAESPQVWFRFEGNKNQQLYFSLGVPVIERLESFRPRVALLGPGMEPIDLSLDIPPGVGGRVYSSGADPRFFHEGFTGTDSWILIEETVRLPAEGTYYLVAYPDTIGSGSARNPEHDKLWLTVGTREHFTLSDLCRFGRWKREVREFHEVP